METKRQQNPEQEMAALRQRLNDQQREFVVLQRAFSALSAQNQATQQLLRIVLHAGNVDEILERTVALMMDVMHAEAGSLFLIDRAADELYFKVARGPVGDQVKGFRVKMGQGIVGWVATENEAVGISDVSRDARYHREISDSVGYEVRSILGVPFRLRGQIVGVFELLNKEGENVFLADDRDMIQGLANTLGLLLQMAGRESVE